MYYMDDILNNDKEEPLKKYSKLSSILMGNDKDQIIMNNRLNKNKNLLKNFNKMSDKDKAMLDKFINIHKNSFNSHFLKSCEFYNSPITLSNWFEEMRVGDVFGISLQIISSNLAKLGVRYEVHIENITMTLVPISNYIKSTIDVFNSDMYDFGNINERVVLTGENIGDSNCVIPIYINKYHWIIAKRYLKPVLGQIFAHNPLGYTDRHQYFMFTIFNDMMKRLFDDDISNKQVQLYIAYLRTCAQICFDNKYNYGIRKYIDMYISDPQKRIFNTLYDYDNIVCQPLCTGYIIPDDKIKLLIKYLVEETVRKGVAIEKYDTAYIYNLESEKFTLSGINEELDELLDNINKGTKYILETLMSFYSMNKILGKLYEKVGSYSRFIKLLENTYGMLPDDLTLFLLNEIKKVETTDILTIESLYQHIGCYYSREETIFVVLQNIKHVKNKDRKKSIIHNEYINIYEPTNKDKLLVVSPDNSMDSLVQDFNKISTKSSIDMNYIIKAFNIKIIND